MTVSGTTTLSSLIVSNDLKLKAGLAVNEFSGDVGLSANSDQAVPTQKAVKTYVDAQISSVNQALAAKAMPGGSSTQDFQAHNLAISGHIAVSNGVIQCGGNPISLTSDLGLYSQVQDEWMRFVTNRGQFRFFADGSVGASALLTISAAGDVGIGTDMPHCKLDVEGDLRIVVSRVAPIGQTKRPAARADPLLMRSTAGWGTGTRTPTT